MKIGYLTQLDENYADELKSINTSKEFEKFIVKWNDWLDNSTKKLTGKDFNKKRLDKARRKKVEPFDGEICALLLPSKIITVSIVANQLKVPWGTAYIRMKETGTSIKQRVIESIEE